MPPASVIAAIGCSAAAGKNPWVPWGILCLLAAPARAPAFLIDPSLHDALQGWLPSGALWTAGLVFLVLAVAESLADKLPVVDKWLVPVSTAFKPFAATAIAAVFALAPMAVPEAHGAGKVGPSVLAADVGLVAAGSLAALTIALGFVYGALAAVGKAGTRLLLAWVPIPGLRVVHSLLDDLFALGATVVALAHPGSVLVAVLALAYLALGLLVAPMLGRLAWIQVRIGGALLAKSFRQLFGRPAHAPRPPRWLADALAARGVDLAAAGILPAYTLRAPGVGRCRGGFLVVAAGGVWFAARALFGTRVWEVPIARLARLGVAETTTARAVVAGARGEPAVELRLWPMTRAELDEALAHGVGAAGLVAVRPASASARAALPPTAPGERFLPADRAGSLRAQALVTLAVAAAAGILTAGVLVPIGAGYLLSPYRRRFAVGLALSAYLAVCTIGTFGLGAPAAILYAAMLNGLALRDLARCACKARVEGLVDGAAFLPLVCGRVWIPAVDLRAPEDLARAGDAPVVADGPWRTIAALLASSEPESPRAAAMGAAS